MTPCCVALEKEIKLSETRCEKNASTNGGDASRVGKIKREDTSYTK